MWSYLIWCWWFSNHAEEQILVFEKELVHLKMSEVFETVSITSVNGNENEGHHHDREFLYEQTL